MDYVGLDLGKSASQLCLVTSSGQFFETRIKTEAESFQQTLGGRSPARILLEASTEAEWVAHCLEALGHEVIVADPNFAPMYAQRSKRVKTDKRDARALCEACRVGAYRSVLRRSERARQRQAQLGVRDSLVRSRTQMINLSRALLRSAGLRVRSGSSESFPRRVRELGLPPVLGQSLAPVLVTIEAVSEQLEVCDAQLREEAREDEVVRRLMSVPGVGVLTALSFVATLDEVERFTRAKQVRAYLGLVPSEYSSGERKARGHITKAGNSRVRRLLVECGWNILVRPSEKSRELRQWGQRIAGRRGRRVAAVAVGRKLAGILFALWRDGTSYGAMSETTAPGS